MLHICRFNEVTDVQRTREGLAIDLAQALRTGIVKDSGTEPEYNNIDDPTKIKGRYNDVFAALDERNSVLNKASVHANNNASVGGEDENE